MDPVDPDGGGWAVLGGQQHLLLMPGYLAANNSDPVVIQVEDPGRPERAVPGTHAGVPIDDRPAGTTGRAGVLRPVGVLRPMFVV